MAALLILIGFMQNWLMKDSLYRSKADALRSQLMTIPMGWFVDAANEGSVPGTRDEQPAAGPGNGQNPGGGHNGAAGNGKGPGGGGGPGGRNAPFLFAPGTSLAYVGADGAFTDLSGAYSVPSPQLTQVEYLGKIRELAADRGLKPRNDYSLLEDARGVRQIVVFLPAGPPDRPPGLLQMGAETSQLTDVMTRQLLIFASLSALALAAGLALYMPVLRRTLVPLSRMAEAVKGTDAGNLEQRLPEHQGQIEIDRLSASFNGMLERLDASFRAEQEATEAMRRFIADASHELRTPLTSIHGFLEVLLRGAAASNPEQLQAALRSMHGESRRINKLVEDLLTLAKLDRAPQLKLAELSLDGLVRGMEPQLRLLAVDRSVSLELTDGIRVNGDGDKIKQVLLNLFQNAVQHTDSGTGAIAVLLMAVRGIGDGARAFAELTVRDNGPGIDDAQLPHLFERFYRGDASRARKYGGSGLGLAITRAIAESHGGSVSVTSRLGEGSAFTVRLPM
nr:HAMP domain-containing sensor histidine kinase [Paenibacillus glycinis]